MVSSIMLIPQMKLSRISHPGLVDLFLSQTRKAYAQEQQKTSVRDMLKKLPETTSPKISAKSKSPER